MDLIEKKGKTNNRHPWELSRLDCLSKEIRRYHIKGSILDVGCGDSFFDRNLLKKDLNISKLYGIDINLNKGIKTGIHNYYIVNSYDKLKGKKFDTIIMFDVLEHIDDNFFLKDKISLLLKDNGKVLITVPAFQFLFSNHDRFLKHYRRYNIRMIKKLCEENNYKIVNYHYFYFSLFLFRVFFRNFANEINDWKYSQNFLITKLYRKLLNIDYRVCKLMNKLSIGLSLFVVLEKNL